MKYSAVQPQQTCHFLRGFFPTDIHFFHTIRHVYRSHRPAREAKPRLGATLVRSAHDCEIGLGFQQLLSRNYFDLNPQDVTLTTTRITKRSTHKVPMKRTVAVEWKINSYQQHPPSNQNPWKIHKDFKNRQVRVLPLTLQCAYGEKSLN